MLGCIHPMSSPMMNRILGFCPCWAETGRLAMVVAAHATTTAPQIVLNRFMVASFVGCKNPGRSVRPDSMTEQLHRRIRASGQGEASVKASDVRYALSAHCCKPGEFLCNVA